MRLLLFISLLSFSAKAQVNITTPRGFDRLYIEMTTEALLAEMGKPERIKTYNEEKRLWVNAGYNLDASIAFVHGFDKVYVFPQNNKYCLWKAYVKDGRVIYMNLTTQFVKDYFYSKVTVNNKIHFKDKISKVEEVLGKDFYKDMDWTWIDYLYHDKGIRFTFQQSRISNIYLYRPFDNRADLYRMVRNYKTSLE